MMLLTALLAGLSGLLLAHMTILPLTHSRAILWRGPELLIATLALVGAMAIHVWWLAGLSLPVVAVALTWRPWVAWGMNADAVVAAAGRSATMVRARYEPYEDARGALVAGVAHVRCTRLAGPVTVVVTSGTVTPKVKLWRNVFRKSVQNHVWRVASSTNGAT